MKNYKLQNIFLFVASIYFYSVWDWRFLILLFSNIIVDYYLGIYLFKSTIYKKRKLLLYVSFIVNLGLLCVFKYFNFFINSLNDLITPHTNYIEHSFSLNLLLPIGISFYTFHGLSYILDIYNGKIKPETSFVNYGLFVSFFPLLVAGPIERASHLLPQILTERKHKIEKVFQGLGLMIFGFFKKIVVADGLTKFIDPVFLEPLKFDGSVVLLSVFYFAIQIYCDFSGYTDIARGIAKLLGFELLYNFHFPYFASNISDFWRRWHISLSSWFRDYVYIPLGGSRKGISRSIFNVLIIFGLSGIWHGANWNFLLWGLFHGILFIPNFLVRKFSTLEFKFFDNRILEISKILFTFSLVCIGWVLFRTPNIDSAMLIYNNIELGLPKIHRWPMFSFIPLLLISDYLLYKSKIDIGNLFFQIIWLVALVFLGSFIDVQPFIYFQF